MKPFDLEKALAGEPFNLDGEKRYAAKQVDGLLIHYSIDKDGKLDCSWNSVDYLEDESGATMWQEPRPRVTLDLPCPLKEPQEGMWFITESGEAVKSNYRYDYTDALNLEGFASGLYFATEEDAQEWLDAMRNARR